MPPTLNLLKQIVLPFHMGLLSLLLGCEQAFFAPMERESIEWIAFDQTGSLLSIRFVKTDTGWLKNTGHFRASIWSPTQSTLEFWDHAPESYLMWSSLDANTPQNIQYRIAERHQLEQQEQTWRIDSHVDEWNLRMLGECTHPQSQTTNDLKAPQGPSWEFSDTWKSTVLCWSLPYQGWSQSHEQSQLLKGQSMVIGHHGSADLMDSLWFVASTPTARLFVEHSTLGTQGSLQLFEAENWVDYPITHIEQNSSGWVLQSPAHTLHLQKHTTIGVEDPYVHIAQWEKEVTGLVMPLSSIKWSKSTTTLNQHPLTIFIRSQQSL